MSSHSDTNEHHHEPGLQHHFFNMKQQEESMSIAMWAFLAQEIMFFGGLFTAYLVFRSRFPLAFAEASNHLNAFWGGLNTIVLIVSSLTMALAVYYAQRGNRNLQVIMIVLTMSIGSIFLGVKAIEYTDKYHSGLVPVNGWNKKTTEADIQKKETSQIVLPFETAAEAAEGGDEYKKKRANPKGEFQWNYGHKIVDDALKTEQATGVKILTDNERLWYFSGDKFDEEKFESKVRIFYYIYFVMTGLHAIHMIIGFGIMIWLLWKAWIYSFTSEYFVPVEMVGLYWHFVDIVWIFLFPLLYLLGRHFIH